MRPDQGTINETPKKGNGEIIGNKIKSPSDTTIYTPGLQRINFAETNQNNRMLDKITNFVESVRQEVTGESQSTQFDSPGTRDNVSDTLPVQLPQNQGQLSLA